MDDDELHAKASDYASNRRDAYIAKMQKGEVKKHSKDILNWIWVAHYEGYKEGYWAATGDDRFTTDPDKHLQKKREFVGLTEEDDIDWEDGGNLKDLVKAIEAKLRSKNT